MSLALAITDNGDGTGAVATVSGSDSATTNTIWTMPAAPMPPSVVTSWFNAGTRSGDGTLALALSPGFYFAYAQGTVSGSPAVSPVTALEAITSGQTSVQEKLMNFVEAQVRILAQTITGFPTDIHTQMVVTDTIATFPAIFITPQAAEQPIGVTNNLDDWGRPVVVSIVDRNDEEYTANMSKYLYWRQTLMRQFHGQRPAGIPQGYFCQVEPAVIFDPKLPAYEYMVSAMTLRFKTREPRTP